MANDQPSQNTVNPYDSPGELRVATPRVRVTKSVRIWLFAALFAVAGLATLFRFVTSFPGPPMMSVLWLFVAVFFLTMCSQQIGYGRWLGYLRQDRLDEAVALMTRMLSRRPTNAQAAVALNQRGFTYLAQADFDRAIADCTAAVHRRPRFAAAYSTRAISYVRIGRFTEALADLNEAVRLRPRDAMMRSNRGLAHEASGRFAEAIVDYQEACRLNRRVEWPVIGLARIWAACPDIAYRDGRRALEMAESAARLNREPHLDMALALADAFAELDRFPEAIRWAKTAVDVAPSEERSRALRHLNCFEAGQPYRLSLVDYVKANHANLPTSQLGSHSA